ncbi:hypothetical protein PFICI_07131 [Pestalotiopsis fici W106-1]|uniref:25S rRNA (Uridine(2843)-N(3))-methyltransferase n=1 Tax=Pestalotiopsis fici (strain W106-1 / CGMCC3.15140) TaxID=1229662 RepID=W3X7X0_PESFW|nr:uncharacterized protein PFICI_07131 [Pestalotiopsis fici W106-1]ETS82129.1 hypothetical protein PFICI_07131 [Pestalotiopsis fici W106-1]
MPGKQKKGTNKRADRDLLTSSKAPSKSSAKQAQQEAAASAAAQEQPAKATPSAEELASQQKLLSIFQSAYSEVLSSPAFSQTLQEVKAALYDREFEKAFAREEYLDVYAARWSPTRALGYAAVLDGLRDWLDGLALEGDDTTWSTPAAVETEGNDETTERLADLSLANGSTNTGVSEATDVAPSESEECKDANGDDQGAESEQQTATTPANNNSNIKTLKVLALGGGTAELAAFVSFLSKSPGVRGDLTLVDAGPWTDTISKLHKALTAPPPIYKYASAAAKAANRALADATTLRYTFLHRDALSLTAADLKSSLSVTGSGERQQQQPDQQPVLVTLLFTLNELYTGGGIGRTTAFLRMLGRTLAPGSLLLVVDSPGSYSEAAVGGDGKNKKKYPMSWLVDHTLLRAGEGRTKKKPQDQDGGDAESNAGDKTKAQAQQEDGCKWEKLDENESIWFRISDELRYPIQLENMRYQMHLYRAVSTAEKTN